MKLFFLLLVLLASNSQLLASGPEIDLLNQIEELNRANQSAVFSWTGKAILTKHTSLGTMSHEIKFGAYKPLDITYFSSRPLGMKDNDSTLSQNLFGFHRQGTTFYTQGEDGTTDVRLSHFTNARKLGLTAVSFDPSAAYYPVGQTTDDFFENIKRCIPFDWFRWNVAKDGNICTVSYGNRELDVEDTTACFDLSRGGVLVSYVNPGPGLTIESNAEHESRNGIWLPKSVRIEHKGKQPMLVEIELETEQFYRIVPLKDLQPTQVLALNSVFVLNDTVQRKSFRVKRSGADSTLAATRFSGADRLSAVLLICAFGGFILWQIMSRGYIGSNFTKLKVGSLFLGALGMLILCIAMLNSTDNPEEVDARKIFCGHWCLVKAARTLGIDTNMEYVNKLLRRRRTGNSFADLATAAASIGMTVEGRRGVVSSGRTIARD